MVAIQKFVNQNLTFNTKYKCVEMVAIQFKICKSK